MSRAAAILLLAWASQGRTADSPDDLLARIRQHMAGNLARLPNYTCLETIERKARPANARRFVLIDRLRLEVAYVGQRELYSWPEAQEFEERPIAEMVGGGAAIGTGSFALHARAVFASNAPEFSPDGEGERGGKRTLRFRYRIPKEKSRYAIKTAAEPVIVAYGGVFEAYADTLALARLEVRADQPPPELKLRSVAEVIEYGESQIGDADFLLPNSSELSMVEDTGAESQNVTHFEGCRQYLGASTVRFDVEGNDAGAGQRTAAIDLPSGLVVPGVLKETVDGAKAARGDVVHVIAAGDVKRSGAVVIPKGAVLTGRVAKVATQTVRSVSYLGVLLLFHTIEFGGRRGGFSSEMESAGVGPNLSVVRDASGAKWLYVKGQSERLLAGTRLVLRTK